MSASAAPSGSRADASNPQAVSTEGFDPSRLLARCKSALHPQTGLCRGMVLNTDKPHDKPGDIFPTKVGELLQIADLIRDCASAIEAGTATDSEAGVAEGESATRQGDAR